MDPSRKRRVRLVTALTVALLLAGALVYTTFSAASPERIPSQLSTAQSGQSYKLGGKVVAGSVKRTPDSMTFQVQDPKGPAKVNVSYTGSVPDPFREGREVIVTVQARRRRLRRPARLARDEVPVEVPADTQSLRPPRWRPSAAPV